MDENFETYAPEPSNGGTSINAKNIVDEDDLNSVLNVPITLYAILGRTRLSVNEIINLAEGSILDLEKAIGEPVDIFINSQKIARGELILVEDELSISLTEIFNIS